MKWKQVQAVWKELKELWDDLYGMAAEIALMVKQLLTLLEKIWNLGVQVVAVLLKIIPVVELAVDRVKRLKFNSSLKIRTVDD